MRIVSGTEYTTKCECGIRYAYSGQELFSGQNLLQCQCGRVLELLDKEIIIINVKTILEINRLEVNYDEVSNL